MRSIPAVEVDDPNFIRLKYLRYADDWISGMCGPRNLAEQVKEELKTFLSQRLKLTLSAEKTKITHARKEQAHFLGTRLAIGREGIQRVVTTYNGSARPIRRRSTGSEIVMTAPRDELIKKLHSKGFCTAKGQPTTKLGWIHLDAEQIITLYNGINRGIQNYYRFADNFGQLVRIQYILKFSLAHTLAAKYKCGVEPDLQTLWQNPDRHHQSEGRKTRPPNRILQQQRLEKATQRLPNWPCISRPAPMEHQIAITLKIRDAMLHL